MHRSTCVGLELPARASRCYVRALVDTHACGLTEYLGMHVGLQAGCTDLHKPRKMSASPATCNSCKLGSERLTVNAWHELCLPEPRIVYTEKLSTSVSMSLPDPDPYESSEDSSMSLSGSSPSVLGSLSQDTYTLVY